MGVKYLLLSLVLVVGILISGCQYTVPATTECTPPAVKMLDINGNTVCVLPEIKTNQTGTEALPETTGQEASQETTEVPTNVEVPPVTGEVVAPITGVQELPRKVVKEGELVSFPNLQAVDPDGDKISYTFTAPLNSQGQWQTAKGDAGDYKVTITASDGTNTVSQDVLIAVESSNSAPIIQLDSAITVKEGHIVSLSPIVQDPDGDNVSVSYSGWMTSNAYQTTYDDSGNYIVTLTASDGTHTVSKDVKVIVENVNRAPVIAPLADVTATEGDKIIIEPTITDPDGDKLQVSFSKPLAEDGTWQTEVGDAGIFREEVTASDGNMTNIRSFTITIKSANKAPVIEILPELTVKEDSTATLEPIVTDPDGDKVQVSYSGWMTSNTKKTTFDDAGTHTVTITATDGINTVTQDVIVNVIDVNRLPEFVTGAFQ
ncbi:MAG: hypothetical protein V1837_00105 [Candidatus Woesearchaeota archaeon]